MKCLKFNNKCFATTFLGQLYTFGTVFCVSKFRILSLLAVSERSLSPLIPSSLPPPNQLLFYRPEALLLSSLLSHPQIRLWKRDSLSPLSLSSLPRGETGGEKEEFNKKSKIFDLDIPHV